MSCEVIATAQLSNLRTACGRNRHKRPNPEPVATRVPEFDSQVVILVAGVVPVVNQLLLVIIGKENIDRAVTIGIKTHHRAPLPIVVNAKRVGHLDEGPITLIVKEAGRIHRKGSTAGIAL